MNELIKLIEDGRLWSYLNYDEDVTGIVIADNEEEAKRKVYESYERHGYADTSFRYTLDVMLIKSKPFEDSLDVLETNYWNG